MAAGSGEPGPGNDVKMSFQSVKGLVFIKKERCRWFTRTGINEFLLATTGGTFTLRITKGPMIYKAGILTPLELLEAD